MTQDSYELDGTVRITEIITHHRYVPQKIYEITQALYEMSEDQQIKVIKYIIRLTGKRTNFKSLTPKMSKKAFFRALHKVDAQNSLDDN